MKKYFLTRLALALPVILLVSVFSFALVFLAPGDPAAQYRTLEMTDEEYEQLKTELGSQPRFRENRMMSMMANQKEGMEMAT